MTTKQATHTPTPWKVKGKFLRGPAREVEAIDIFSDKASGIKKQLIDSSVGSCFLEEDAAFIVKAVNCHDEAFKLLRLLVINGQIGGNFLKEAYRLIAKAEEK